MILLLKNPNLRLHVHQHDCSVLGVAVASGAADVPNGWFRPLVASPGATESTANGEGAEEQPEAPAADMDADPDFADCAAAAAAVAVTMEASAADTAIGTSTSAQRDAPPSSAVVVVVCTPGTSLRRTIAKRLPMAKVAGLQGSHQVGVPQPRRVDVDAASQPQAGAREGRAAE